MERAPRPQVVGLARERIIPERHLHLTMRDDLDHVMARPEAGQATSLVGTDSMAPMPSNFDSPVR